MTFVEPYSPFRLLNLDVSGVKFRVETVNNGHTECT